MGLLIILVSYLCAYLLVPLFSGKYNQILRFVPLTGISISGSFIFSLYILSHTIIDGILNSSAVAASDFYSPAFIVFVSISAVFFVISAIILAIATFIIKSREYC
jgi:hypothetical protein